MGVISHKDFFAEGSDYTWMHRVSSVEHMDFDNWAVWSALNQDTGKTEYFVVEEDTEFIDWGPVDTEKEAKEFLQSKVDDYNLDESIELTDKQMAKVDEISDRYCTLTPVSGNWDTEVEHQADAIADALNISIDEAKTIMKDYLGFTDDQLNESISPEYKMVEYTYDGDELSDYLGHVRVRTNSDKVALHAAEEYVMNKQFERNPRNFKICNDSYNNVDVIDSYGDFLTRLESVTESKSIKESTKWSKSGPSLYTLRTAKGKAEVYKPVNSKQFELTVYDNNGNYIVGPTSVNNYYPSKESAMLTAEKYLVNESLTEASAGFQKEFYNGYVIIKNRAGDGWDVYSYDGTPEHVTKLYKEDEGYATLNDAKKFIDSLSESLTEDADTSNLKSNIKSVVNQVMADKGYDEDEIEAYTAIEIKDVDENFIEVEVRAELGYDALMNLCDKLDPIVAAVDPYAYFEPITSGIASAFVRKDQ